MSEKNSGTWRDAFGAAPTPDCDELPEETIRRIRDEEGDDLVATRAGSGAAHVGTDWANNKAHKLANGAFVDLRVLPAHRHAIAEALREAYREGERRGAEIDELQIAAEEAVAESHPAFDGSNFVIPGPQYLRLREAVIALMEEVSDEEPER